MSSISADPTRRPGIVVRILAGVGVVSAMLVPVVAPVLAVLYFSHLLPLLHMA